MKFDIDKVNGRTAGLCTWIPSDNAAIINGDVEVLVALLKDYSHICGAKTKQRLCDAINRISVNAIDENSDLAKQGVNYSDTPIRGVHYVYLWFDSSGELFYIGKGMYNRATDMRSRKPEFREKAEGGRCRYVAYNMDEIYALDLERILIWEAAFAGKPLLNVDGGDGMEAIQYFKHDRDALLYYWNREGAIDCFSELTGIQAIYNVQNMQVNEAIDERKCWWDRPGQQTNDPIVLAAQRKANEMKQKQREYQAARMAKKKQENSCRA